MIVGRWYMCSLSCGTGIYHNAFIKRFFNFVLFVSIPLFIYLSLIWYQ